MAFSDVQLQRIRTVGAAARELAVLAGRLEEKCRRAIDVQTEAEIDLTSAQCSDYITRIVNGKAAVNAANTTVQAA